jgi:hypothetical protein
MDGDSAPRLWLLWAGAGAGLSLAIGSLSLPSRHSSIPLPERAVAMVNGVEISRVDYDVMLRTIEESERRPLTEDDKRAAVGRLIEDELMIEHGLDLGMVRGDLATRHALLSAVFAAERAPGEASEPSPDALERFYLEIRNELRKPGKMRLRQIVIRAKDRMDQASARAKAEDAMRRLRAGVPFEGVRVELEGEGEKPLPDRLLDATELRPLVGPITLERANELEVGQVSDVIGYDHTFRVVQLVERGPEETATLEEARDAVLARYWQKSGDEAFARKIRALRAAARIRTMEKLP